MLYWSDRRTHSCLIPNLTGNAVSFSLCAIFLSDILSGLEGSLLVLVYNSFYHEWLHIKFYLKFSAQYNEILISFFSFNVVCCCLVTQSCLTLCKSMDCSMPGLPVIHHLPEFAQIHVHRVSDDIQPSHPLSFPLLLPLIFPSIRIFSNVSVLCIRWPKYWTSFSFSISPSSEYSGLISFRIDWFVLLAVQRTLKSLLQQHSSKASILWYSSNSHIHIWLLEKP